MSAGLVAACLSWGVLQTGSTLTQALEERLQAGDYHGAWSLVESERDAHSRWRARAEILYRAGDPSGALAAAREGLEQRPDDVRLLFHASGACLWLQEPAEARRYAERLEKVLEGGAVEDPSEQEAWRAVARDFVRRSLALAQHDEAVRTAVGRARTVSLAVLIVVTGFLAWASTRGQGTSGQGRSSSPVS